MSLSNLHTHTNFSDGSNPPEDYILEALRQGFSCIGFSDHSPLPFENNFAIREERTAEYCDEILLLKDQYKDRIEVFLGMEVDYIPGTGHTPDWFRSHYPLDFIIGSVHLVKNPGKEDLWFIDGPYAESYDRGLESVFGGDIVAGVTAYYRQLQEMITLFRPDIVGHLDKIKMHNRNRYFREDEPWYVKLTDDTLDAILKAGCRMEVNTRGLYKKRSETLFPGREILRRASVSGIPAVIATDAHKPCEIGLYLKEAGEVLRQAGYTVGQVFTGKGWKDESV